MGIENAKDKEIMDDFLSKFNLAYEGHKYFNDGVSSRVILLNNKYLIKQNSKEELKGEVEYLNLNKSELMQKVFYVEENYEYVAFEFIKGKTMEHVYEVNDLINKITIIINNYKPYNKEGYGYLTELVTTWEDFLFAEISDSKKNAKEYIKDDLVLDECFNIIKQVPFTKKLLHGDFGTHNFIEDNGKFVGVIDPMPVIGDGLYDLLFALVSNVDILKTLTIADIIGLSQDDSNKVLALFGIVLYSRISRCLKYHPEDIEIYLDYWEQFVREFKKEIINKE